MVLERMGREHAGIHYPKSLQCASSTTLVAALDPSLKGMSEQMSMVRLERN